MIRAKSSVVGLSVLEVADEPTPLLSESESIRSTWNAGENFPVAARGGFFDASVAALLGVAHDAAQYSDINLDCSLPRKLRAAYRKKNARAYEAIQAEVNEYFAAFSGPQKPRFVDWLRDRFMDSAEPI